MIEVRQARYFLAVAEELHFGRAAARLQMSQPPLSQAIKALERQLSTELFERSRRSVTLTAPGRAFLSECRTLIRAAEDAEEAARRATTGRGGIIRLGAVASAFSWPLPEVVTQFRNTHPDVELRVEEIDTHEAAPKLLERTLDWAIVRQIAPFSGTEVTPLLSDEFVVVLPPEYQTVEQSGLVIEAPMELAYLAEKPWIWLHRDISPDYHDAMAAMCRTAGFSPSPTHWARSVTSQIAMVRSGLGVTIVPASAVRSDQDVLVRRLVQAKSSLGLTAVTRALPEAPPSLLTSLAKNAIDTHGSALGSRT